MPVPTVAQLESLSDALKHKLPYCSGTLPLTQQDLVLFYGKDKGARRMEFASVTDEELADLAQCCEVATFGRNHEDVLDESYRKAGKLDAAHFAPKLEVERTGLVNIIRGDLLEGTKSKEDIRVEMYKLNVYGKGSFFKAHKDTPRSESMFGTLVLFFPTNYEGGSLILRDHGNEWIFDSASAVKAQQGHCIAYAAFFGDVEHEVAEVISGYRVTVTYNLYFERPKFPPKVGVTDNTSVLNAAFEKLLSDPTFLPDGGLLGFGLHREYALDKRNKGGLQIIASCLKGRDESLMQACLALGLSAKLYLIFEDDEYGAVVVDKVPKMNKGYIEDGGLSGYLQENYGGKLIERSPQGYSKPLDATVYWISPMTTFTKMQGRYTTYGNEPTVAYAYGYVCLIVDIGEYGSRAVAGNVLEGEEPEDETGESEEGRSEFEEY